MVDVARAKAVADGATRVKGGGGRVGIAVWKKEEATESDYPHLTMSNG